MSVSQISGCYKIFLKKKLKNVKLISTLNKKVSAYLSSFHGVNPNALQYDFVNNCELFESNCWCDWNWDCIEFRIAIFSISFCSCSPLRQRATVLLTFFIPSYLGMFHRRVVVIGRYSMSRMHIRSCVFMKYHTAWSNEMGKYRF